MNKALVWFLGWYLWAVVVILIGPLLRDALKWLNDQPSGTQTIVTGFLFLLLPLLGRLAFWGGSEVVSRIWPETHVLVGELTPADEKDPPSIAELRKTSHADALFVDMGTIVGITEKTRTTILHRGGRDLLAVNRVGSGITIDALALDRNGDAVAVIEGNQFYVNPTRYFPRPTHPDKHTIVLFDLQGNEVLRVRLINQTTVVVRGTWYGGRPLVVSDKGIHVGNQGFEKFSVNIPRDSNVTTIFAIDR